MPLTRKGKTKGGSKSKGNNKVALDSEAKQKEIAKANQERFKETRKKANSSKNATQPNPKHALFFSNVHSEVNKPEMYLGYHPGEPIKPVKNATTQPNGSGRKKDKRSDKKGDKPRDPRFEFRPSKPDEKP